MTIAVNQHDHNCLASFKTWFGSGRLILLSMSLLRWTCAESIHAETSDPAPAAGTLCFPDAHLREGENIQSFKIRIVGGSVQALQRTPEDWDLAIHWESGGCVIVEENARHFSSGLMMAESLND